MKLIEHIVWILMILAAAGVVGTLIAGQSNYAEAHAYADAVLEPRFSAAYNDWRYQHPRDRQSWKNLDERMKAAGYE